MTDDLPFDYGDSQPMLAPAAPRKCRRHSWTTDPDPRCSRCGRAQDPTTVRRGRNNRKRGGAAELKAARALGGRKVGPLGHPWDIEMVGYARLQVKKLANPPSLRSVIGMLDAIGAGAEMPGVVWIEPGRGGEALIVFRLKDYSERHGVPTVAE